MVAFGPSSCWLHGGASIAYLRDGMSLRIKRVYEPLAAGDGFRVLVDRVWPRGLSKERAAVDLWLREIAPSTGLRKWFGHDPARFPAFRARYREELEGEPARGLLADLALRAARGPVTLVFGAKDEAHNQAVVLAEAIEGLLAQGAPSLHP